jgi:hypothetical protein
MLAFFNLSAAMLHCNIHTFFTRSGKKAMCPLVQGSNRSRISTLQHKNWWVGARG